MEQKPQNEPWWKPGAEVFGQVSAWVVVPIIAALFAGKWLDGLYGTKPWIFLGLSCVGFLISSFGIVLVIGKYLKKIAPRKNAKSSEPK